MDDSQTNILESVQQEIPLQESIIASKNDPQLAINNGLLINDNATPLQIADESNNIENQINEVSPQNEIIASETNPAIPTNNSMPPLPPLPKDDKEPPPQPPVSYSADYNTQQNYANYNYMYNYNNYYGYPYPQYQWDYNSQQYYQPYQNYYNYNYNTNQSSTSKPPPPPPDSVQLPVEEKPINKSNASNVDDSNRYSPTAEPDDDPIKGQLDLNKSDIPGEQSTTSVSNSVQHSLLSEQSEIQQNIPESIVNTIQQAITTSNVPAVQHPAVPLNLPVIPLNMSVIQQPVVSAIPQVQQPYNIPVQQSTYLINPQIQVQPAEAVEIKTNQQHQSPALNGNKDDSVEKVSKTSTVLGKTQAKKRLMAFSMMKQKLQEQSNSINDSQNVDIGEGNDVEFVPELNVFQTATKKKVVTNKKVVKVIKAQQTIEQIEEMKKDELLQGNNAALYQHLLRSGGNEAPILQKLGIESLAEKYSAKIREQDKRLKRHSHRRRSDNRRGSHKYRRRSHSKSRSRSRSLEKPKMRALDVKSWKDFVNGGFHFDKFRRFKFDEAEEIKEKDRKTRTKKRHSDSRAENTNQNRESLSIEDEKGNGDRKLRYNILDRKKEILKSFEVARAVPHDGDFTKDFPSYIIQYTKTKPILKYSQNPAKATCHLMNRQQMFATLLPEIEAIIHNFLSSMKPKKLKENPVENYNDVDEKLLVMTKDKNLYPFKGWWPKIPFIATQVREDPNIEIDKDALINEFTISKRTKKSRFNDDTSLIDLRPTVPSKWDSDYDGSPVATNKTADVEVSQNLKMDTTNHANLINNKHKFMFGFDDACKQGDGSNLKEKIDNASDIGRNKSMIDINICPILPPSVVLTEPQGYAKLDTEYEEFLKIVSAEKTGDQVENDIPILKENENNVSIKSVSLNNESTQVDSEDDSLSKSSDESVSLTNAEESITDNLSSIDKKLKKKKKTSSKKSKKFKKKENKKKKHKSSSSESSQNSESESDSSSQDTESESSDSTSSMEKKKKKKKSKDKEKKKKKSKSNNKKKHKSDRNKIKKPEDEKDSNSSILNLLEKAFNVEIKKRPLDSEEPKQKKKKRRHEKKEEKSSEENENEIKKIKECLKETFTKFVKTDKDKVNKSQSLSCDDSTVSEVFKYFQLGEDKEKKNKKSKKMSKRISDSDISDEEIPLKKPKFDEILRPDGSEKKKKNKKKKSAESDERVSKKKSKKKSKMTDTSETDDGDGVLKHKKSKKDNDSDHFFGLRPNEWNVNQSSMRGVVLDSDVNNEKYLPSSKNNSDINNLNQSISPSKKKHNLNDNNLSPLNKNKERIEQKEEKHLKIEHEDRLSQVSNESFASINIDKTDKKKNIVRQKIRINLRTSDSESGEEEQNLSNDKISTNTDQCNVLKHKTTDPCPTLSTNDGENKQTNKSENLHYVLKPIQSKPFDQIDKFNTGTAVVMSNVPTEEVISYRDKVKMNLKQLSISQDTPFVGFGFSSLNFIKPQKLQVEKIPEKTKMPEEEKVKPIVDESNLLYLDRPKVVIYPQTQKKKSNVTKITPAKIDMEATKGNRNFNWENSEDSSDSNQSILKNNNVLEQITNKEENESIKSDFLNTNLLTGHDENQLFQKETLNDDEEMNVRYRSIDTTGKNCSGSEPGEQKQFQFLSEDSNQFVERESIPISNFTDFSEFASNIVLQSDTNQFESNSSRSQNYVEQEILKKDTNSSHAKYSNADSQGSKSSNELISQWTSDWSELDKSVDAINNSGDNRFNNSNQLPSKQKSRLSRWDAKSKKDNMSETQNFADGQEALVDNLDSCNFNELKSQSFQFFEDKLLEQNQSCEISSINCLSNSIECNYSANWPNEYNYSQSYEQYSCIPQYSEMKIIEHNQLDPVDYSVYENYNPSYTYYNEEFNMWKSTNNSNEEMTSSNIEISVPVQVGNVLEIFPSNDTAEYSKEGSLNETSLPTLSVHVEPSNEGVGSILPVQIGTSINEFESNKGKTIENRSISSSTCRDEQFSQLYQQYFKHYNQNPIQYSMSEPILNNLIEINSLDVLEKSPIEDKLSDQENNENIPVPLRARSYWCIIEDNNNKLYVTSDNYMAYCAVEDKCMVHLAIESSRQDNIDCEVRHCFNVYQNGIVNEYWLHADLIPFYVPSDIESGVFSDEDESSGESDSGLKDIEDDSKQIDGEWEIIDSDSDDSSNDWLNEPNVINKYGENDDDVEQSVISQEFVSSSSEYDTDDSNDLFECNDLHSTEEQNISHKSLVSGKQENVILSVVTPEETKEQFGNRNLDLHVETNENPLDSNIEENINNTNNIEVSKDVLLKIKTEIDDDISIKLEEKEIEVEKESNLVKKEVDLNKLTAMSTIIHQKVMIQRLKINSKKIQEKKPDTLMVSYSDNMEIVKHPFLGLFQPPTISILSKNRNVNLDATTTVSKRVSFADGVLPGDNLMASPTHHHYDCPLSPPPIKNLLRETLKIKHNKYPFRRLKMRTRLIMLNKNKVAAIPPSVKASASSVIEYYISHRCPENFQVEKTDAINSPTEFDSSNNDNYHNRKDTPPRPKRETTPVPSDNDCWNDDDNNYDDF